MEAGDGVVMGQLCQRWNRLAVSFLCFSTSPEFGKLRSLQLAKFGRHEQRQILRYVYQLYYSPDSARSPLNAGALRWASVSCGIQRSTICCADAASERARLPASAERRSEEHTSELQS